MKRFEMAVAGLALACWSCAVDDRSPGLIPGAMGETATEGTPADGNRAAAPSTEVLPEAASDSGGSSGPTQPAAESDGPPVALNGSGTPSSGDGANAAASAGAGGASGAPSGGASGAPSGGASGASSGGASGASSGGASGAAGGGASGAAGGAGAPDVSAEPTCPSGSTYCSGVCVDLSTSAEDCGFCGIACGNGEACQNFVCVCSSAASPCVSENHTVESPQYGILNLAAYRDATRDWVAYADTNGVDATTVRIHDVATQADTVVADLPSWEVQLAFAPNDPTLLFSNAGTVYRFREGPGVQAVALPGASSTSRVDWFELSPDGTRLATWDFVTLAVYAYPSLTQLASLDVTVDVVPQLRRLGFSNDGTKVAISGGYDTDQIQVFDLPSGTSRVLSAVGATGTYSPTFSLDGTRLYVGGGYADGHVYVFDTTTGNALRQLQPFSNYLYTIDRVPGFDQLLVGGYDGSLEIISAVDGTPFWSSSTGPINRATFSPDGRHIYVGTGSGGGAKLIVLDVQQ